MADKIICDQGHWYDQTLYMRCPHCENGLVQDGNISSYKTEVSRYAMEYLNVCLYGEKCAEKDNLEECGGQVMRPKNEIVLKEEVGVKTVSLESNRQKNYFVTGWLVCTKGPDIGHSFNLYYGYNTIGCNRKNQVCLMGDVNIAMEVHCSVIYEDRKNRFFLASENGYSTSLNGMQINEGIELQSGDLIEIGESELEFIAFCRGEKKWDKNDLKKFIQFRHQ